MQQTSPKDSAWRGGKDDLQGIMRENTNGSHYLNQKTIAQSAGVVEYTDCFSAVRSPYECPGYDTKQSDGEVLVMLELLGMRRIPSLPLLPGPLWPEMVAPDKALSMG